jgi:hypothetical protein
MLHHFTEMTVQTDLQPNGEYTAIEADNYDLAERCNPGRPMGWGCCRFSAIADLTEQLRERGELEDDNG